MAHCCILLGMVALHVTTLLSHSLLFITREMIMPDCRRSAISKSSPSCVIFVSKSPTTFTSLVGASLTRSMLGMPQLQLSLAWGDASVYPFPALLSTVPAVVLWHVHILGTCNNPPCLSVHAANSWSRPHLLVQVLFKGCVTRPFGSCLPSQQCLELSCAQH
jgi:hypothetical protein